MKRLIGTLAVAAALLAGLSVSAATAKDAKGPPCTNFLNGDASYTYHPSTTSGTVTAELYLDAANCTGTYLLRIYPFTSTGTGRPLVKNIAPSCGSLPDCANGFTTNPETGNTIVNFSYTFGAGAPSDGVCLVAESYQSDHVADRAPNSGCFAVAAGSSGGSGFGG